MSGAQSEFALGARRSDALLKRALGVAEDKAQENFTDHDSRIADGRPATRCQ